MGIQKAAATMGGLGVGGRCPKGRGRAATATAIGNALLPHYVTKERQRGGERGRKGKANDQHTFQAAKRSAKGRGRGRGSQCRERTDDPRQQTRAGHERERARQTARAAEFNNLRRPWEEVSNPYEVLRACVRVCSSVWVLKRESSLALWQTHGRNGGKVSIRVVRASDSSNLGSLINKFVHTGYELGKAS